MARKQAERKGRRIVLSMLCEDDSGRRQLILLTLISYRYPKDTKQQCSSYYQQRFLPKASIRPDDPTSSTKLEAG